MQAPRRAQFLAVLAVLVIGSLLAGCGGGSGDDAKALLKRGFSESIPSANVSVDVNVSVQGLPQLSQPIRVHIGGPHATYLRGLGTDEVFARDRPSPPGSCPPVRRRS